MDPATDDALLAGFGTGDPESALAFVRRFQSRVFGVAVAVLGDRTLAEDVAQEAFLRAWRAADTYDPRRGAVATWLCSIARNAAIDRHRARRSRPEAPLDAAGPLLVDVGSADSRSTAVEEADQLVPALRRLPEGQRRAVVLAAMGGRSAREVATVEGIPLGTAKTRIRDGLLRLRADLDVVVEAERNRTDPSQTEGDA